MSEPTTIYSGYKTTVSYNWMLKRARMALEDAKNADEGQMFHSMDTIVYGAFAVEAFLNHIGAHRNKNWENIERGISKYTKLENFKRDLGITTGKFEEPYKSVNDAFSFRDLLAHGKTETIHYDGEAVVIDDGLGLSTKWMELSNVDNAEKVLTDIEEVIREIFTAAGLGSSPFTAFESSSHSVKVVL